LARRTSRLRLVAQWVVAAIVIGFAVRAVAKQWRDVAPALAELRFDWLRVLGSGVLVLATYLILIEAWRATLRVWSQSLPFMSAARIWFVSNLGKYVPGKSGRSPQWEHSHSSEAFRPRRRSDRAFS
jgi:hypothetical protein